MLAAALDSPGRRRARRGLADQGRAVLADPPDVPDGPLQPALAAEGGQAGEADQDRDPGRPLPARPRPRRSAGARASSRQPLSTLAAARPLGPQPQVSTGCQAPCFTFGLVSGRVNAIAFDPVNTSVAYIAQDGGGIWKTTNCCSPGDDVDGHDRRPDRADDDDRRRHGRPEQPQRRLRGDRRPELRLVRVRQRRRAEEHRRRRDLADARRERLHAGLPGGAGGSYPQYQAVGKVRVDPNASNKVVVGTKTGLYFSYNGGTSWSGPCLTNVHLDPAPGHHGAHPPRRRHDDVGVRGGRRARLRHVRPAEPRAGTARTALDKLATRCRRAAARP